MTDKRTRKDRKASEKINIDWEFLDKILKIRTPSGSEFLGSPVVIDYLRETLHQKVDQDSYGSLCTTLKPSKGGQNPFVMLLDAHLDEIGMRIIYIDECGFIYVSFIGGEDKCIDVARHVLIHTQKGDVPGVVGTCPIHLKDQLPDEINEPDWKDLVVDIGVTSKEEAEKKVSIGDPITLTTDYVTLNNDLISGRAIDNHVGVFVLTQVLANLRSKRNYSKLKIEVIGCFSVQEESGGEGSQMMTYRHHPNAAIIIDTGIATDVPYLDPTQFGDIELNKGPIVNRTVNEHAGLQRHIVDTAKKSKVPFQYHAPTAGGTNLDLMYCLRQGTPSMTLLMPARYLHSPVSLIHKNDIRNTIKLLVHTLLNMPAHPELRLPFRTLPGHKKTYKKKD